MKLIKYLMVIAISLPFAAGCASVPEDGEIYYVYIIDDRGIVEWCAMAGCVMVKEHSEGTNIVYVGYDDSGSTYCNSDAVKYIPINKTIEYSKKERLNVDISCQDFSPDKKKKENTNK